MKGVEFVLSDENTGQNVNYLYENGLVEYINNVNINKTPMCEVLDFQILTPKRISILKLLFNTAIKITMKPFILT